MSFLNQAEYQAPMAHWSDQKRTYWNALLAHAQQLKKVSLPAIFAQGENRIDRYMVEAGPLWIDYSKQMIDDQALSLLIKLANESQLTDKLEALFSGGIVNRSENRPALHHALRSFLHKPKTPYHSVIELTWHKMIEFVQGIHSRKTLGATGSAIRSIVNIGIGGSDLGPRLLVEALRPFHLPYCEVHFVSNVDPSEISLLLPTLKPEETLFIFSSKSFSTMETLKNAEIALDWLKKNLGASAVASHTVAVTAAVEKAQALGITLDRIFPVWDWVGGRYSVWSAIGLCVLLAIGEQHFRDFLRGGFSVDEQVQGNIALQNPATTLALIDVWNYNFLGAQSQAVIPYSSLLRSFPDYLQQLMMESNGKRVTELGVPLSYTTCPVIWGSVGTNSQHSFHQLIHQGTSFFPVDFILPLSNDWNSHLQQQLVASCLGQSQAMLCGRSKQEIEAAGLSQSLHTVADLAEQQVVAGSKPHTLFIAPKIEPFVLGALIALYEHRVFVQSVIWEINPFDQWGVELGKRLSNQIYPLLPREANVSYNEEVLFPHHKVIEKFREVHHTLKKPS